MLKYKIITEAFSRPVSRSSSAINKTYLIFRSKSKSSLVRYHKTSKTKNHIKSNTAQIAQYWTHHTVDPPSPNTAALGELAKKRRYWKMAVKGVIITFKPREKIFRTWKSAAVLGERRSTKGRYKGGGGQRRGGFGGTTVLYGVR